MIGKTKMIKAIFLDLDGTLANSLSVMRLAYESFLKIYEKIPSNEEFQALNGPPLPSVIRELKKNHSLSEGVALLEQRYQLLLDEVYYKSAPSLGAKELLLEAKLNNCLIGIVTSNAKARTRRWLDCVNFSSMVDFIVSGDDVTLGKPDPEPYIQASKIAACPLSEIIVVEDSLHGANAAVSAGLRTFIVGSRDTNQPSLLQRGVEYVETLNHLAKRVF
jgi:HAD superfamily hydrolase (TIGR01509 family)